MIFPSLIVIGGFAGSGKSTLSRNLSTELGIPAFEIDQMASAIQRSKGFTGGEYDHYIIAFDLFFSLAERILQNRGSLILDQNMGRAHTWENIQRLVSSVSNAQLKVFLLDCPFDVCLSRVDSRKEHPNLLSITSKELPDHKYKWDYLRDTELPLAIRIDATKPSEEVFTEVFQSIKDLKLNKNRV